MRGSFMLDLEGKKIYLRTYTIQVHNTNGEVTELSCNEYYFEDVFEFVKEHYRNKNDESINKVVIQVKE